MVKKMEKKNKVGRGSWAGQGLGGMRGGYFGLMGRSCHERNFGDRRLKAKWASMVTVFGQEQSGVLIFTNLRSSNGRTTFWPNRPTELATAATLQHVAKVQN